MARSLSNPVRLASPEKGVDGRTTLAKARAPLITDGRIGDFFVDIQSKKLYGPKNAAGWPDNGLIKGDGGWSPVLGVATDGIRRVYRVNDWQGGEGAKPEFGQYVGASGLVDAISDAADVRGPMGPEMSVDGLDQAQEQISDNTVVASAEPGDDNKKRAAVEVFDIGSVLQRRSVAHAQNSEIRGAIKAVHTRVFSDATGKGAASYHRVSSEPEVPSSAKFRSLDRWTADGQHDSANGGWWIISNEVVTPEMVGAYADGVHDDFEAVQATATLNRITEWQGDISQTAPIYVSANGKVSGRGANRTRVKRTFGTLPVIRADVAGATIEGLHIDNQASDGFRSGHVVRVTCDDFSGRDLTLENFGLMAGSTGGGTGVLVTPGVGRPKRPRLENMNIYGNPLSQASIGWLYDQTDYGFVSHVYAETIVGSAGVGYAHELKNSAKWNNLHALTARASEVAFACGQEGAGLGEGAAYNVLFGLLADGVDMGIAQGFSIGNVTVGSVINADGRPGDATRSYALSLYNAQKEIHAAINNFGAGANARAVTISGESTRNVVQIANHAEATAAVTIADASRGNVIDLLHPGEQTSILDIFTDTSGAPTHGAGANVIYSQATGEQLGTMSGRFRWYLGNPGAVFQTSHRFQMARDADAILAFGTPSANVAGIAHATPGGTISTFIHTPGATRDLDAWTMNGWGVGNRFAWSRDDYSPTTTNAVSLGTSALRWLKGWFGNISLFPANSVTPTVNGEVTFQLTTNTQLTFKVRGTDGTVRSGSITLS